MGNGLILGAEGYKKLALGYEININDTKRKAFSVAASETNGILPGDLLVVTGSPQVYKKATTVNDVVAGIALATNIKVDPLFPQSSTEVKFLPGEKGGVLVQGEVAVRLYGTAPTEGDKVYFNITQNAFTNVASGALALPGARFTGKVEGDLAVINVQYI